MGHRFANFIILISYTPGFYANFARYGLKLKPSLRAKTLGPKICMETALSKVSTHKGRDASNIRLVYLNYKHNVFS